MPDTVLSDDEVGLGSSLSDADVGIRPGIEQGLVKKQEPYLELQPQGTGLFDTRIPLRLVRKPETVGEGIYNVVAKAASSMISPGGVAVSAVAPIKAVQPIIAGVFGGLGAKSAGEAVGTLLGSQNLTTGQKTELLGDAAVGITMMLPAALAPLTSKAVTETIKEKGPTSAQTIRSDTGQPKEPGLQPQGSQADRSRDVQQAPPGPPDEAAPQAQKVVTAATYTNPDTGETTTGPHHPAAAAAQGVEAPAERAARETPEFGFQVQDTATGKTETVSRDTAEQVARESGQLLQEPKSGKVHSDEIASPTEPGVPLSESQQLEEQARLASELGEEAPPPVIEGEAQPTVPAAGKAEGGASAPPAPAIPEGGISPAKVQVGEVDRPVGMHGGFAVEKELRRLAEESTPDSSRDLETGRKVITGNGLIFSEALRVWEKTKSLDRVGEFLDGTGLTSASEIIKRIRDEVKQAKPSEYDRTPLKETVYRGDTGKEQGSHIGTSVTTSKEVAESYGPTKQYTLNANDVLKYDQRVPLTDFLSRGGTLDLMDIGDNPTGQEILEGVTRWLREKHGDSSPKAVGEYLKGLGWQAYKMADQSFVFDPSILKESKTPPAKSIEPPPTLTPAESTRLKSLTEKMESGKPLTSAEQKRYRALKDKVSPSEESKPEVEAAAPKAPSKFQSLVTKAIINNELPESALGWDVVEAARTTVLRGSGESTSYHPHVTVRVNGKQVWRGTETEFGYKKPLEGLGELVPIGKQRGNSIFVRKPPTTPPSTGEGMVGPGSPSITQPPDPGSQIEQLTSAFKNIEGRKVSVSEKLGDAFKLGERLSATGDRLSKSISGLKTAGNYLIGKWKQVQNIDDLLRAKGELSEAKETRGWQVRKWVQQAKQATPSPRDQAAISKWIDSGGNEDVLRTGMAQTKPRFKRAYEDALNLSPDLKVAAQNISNYFDSRLQEAVDAGVLKDGIEDYIHRIYERKPDLAKRAFAHVQDGLLQRNPSLTKQRLFEFDWQAEKEGFVPVQSYIDRIADYESSLSRAIAAREFIKKATEMKAADGRPIVDIKGVGIPIENPEGVREATLIKPKYDPAYANTPGTPKFRGDYVDREYPALSRWKWVSQDSQGKPIYVQGDVAIHPDYVKRIDALLEPSRVRFGRYGGIARPALAVSSAVKQTMLDFSGFHQVQVTVHGMEHRVMPWKITQDIDFKNPDIKGLLQGGVTLGGDYRFSKEGLVGSSLTRHVPFLGPALDTYHQWLFQDYIPRLKMTMAMHALERNRVRYAGQKTPEEIFHLTASEANAAFGEQNYIMLERSKTAQDMARLILLAPDFLEARGRFAGQALTKGGKQFGNEQRTALLLGALTMWVTARLMNKALDGQPHNEPENLFSVVYNGKAYGLRTVQGDILHLIEKPLQFWMHRLNPVFGRTAMEAATGRDEFGRKRTFSQQVWDGVSTTIPIALRSSREKSIWESMANAFGVTARRWSDVDDAFKLAREWKAKHGVTEPGEFIYDPDKDPLRGLKIALSFNDEGGATKEIKKLVDSKQYTLAKLQQHFNRYAHMPFTGSIASDVKWKKTLTEDQSKTVEAALEHKRAMLRLFYQAARKYNAAKQQ